MTLELLRDEKLFRKYMSDRSDGASVRHIAKELDVGYSTLRKYLTKYGIEYVTFRRTNNCSESEILEIIKNNKSWNDILIKLNLSYHNNNIRRLKYLCVNNEVSTKHLNRKSSVSKFTDDDIFCKDSKASRGSLRKRLFQKDLYTGECANCGIGDVWVDKLLTLEIEHINGDSRDHRIENLEWLCPNCHSQTKTYRRGKKRRVARMK